MDFAHHQPTAALVGYKNPDAEKRSYRPRLRLMNQKRGTGVGYSAALYANFAPRPGKKKNCPVNLGFCLAGKGAKEGRKKENSVSAHFPPNIVHGARKYRAAVGEMGEGVSFPWREKQDPEWKQVLLYHSGERA